MRERPIIFSGEMVRAILEGKKTQTRRVMKPDWVRALDLGEPEDLVSAVTQCPYGQVGDRLWVRETWHRHDDDIMCYRATEICIGFAQWKPSIFMPRKYSRITLEIVNIRVERVQDITFLDAIAEGVDIDWPERNYRLLWNRINSKRGYGWDVNPWVWCLTFAVTK